MFMDFFVLLVFVMLSFFFVICRWVLLYVGYVFWCLVVVCFFSVRLRFSGMCYDIFCGWGWSYFSFLVIMEDIVGDIFLGVFW